MSKEILLSIIMLLFFSISAYGQFGVSARIQNNTNKTWNNNYQSVADTSQTLFSSSYEFGVNYWFKLKEYRVEFLPELSYAVSETNPLFSALNVASHTRQSFYFNFNVQIYPLDFIGDCDCPTFSKEGNTLTKGFYWLFSPGIAFHNLSTTMAEGVSAEIADANITSLRIGGGAGVDLGINNMLTVSPFLMYSLNIANNWPEQKTAYEISDSPNNNSASINQWHFGLRLVFRPDY